MPTLDDARGTRFGAGATLELLTTGDPWTVYSGASRRRIEVAVQEAVGAMGAASVVDDDHVDVALAVTRADAAQAAVERLQTALGEVRRAAVRTPGVIEAAEGSLKAAGAAVDAASGSWKVDGLRARLAGAAAGLAAARAAEGAADPLGAVAGAEAAGTEANAVLELAGDLPFRRQRLLERAAAVTAAVEEGRADTARLGPSVAAWQQRWAPALVAGVAGAPAEAGRLLDLAATQAAEVATALDPSRQAWEAAEGGAAAAEGALAQAQAVLARPGQVVAALDARAAAWRTSADGVRTRLRWNRDFSPADAPALEVLAQRLDAAAARLDGPGTDLDALDAELAAVDAEVQRIDQARLAREQQRLAQGGGGDGGWEQQQQWPPRRRRGMGGPFPPFPPFPPGRWPR